MAGPETRKMHEMHKRLVFAFFLIACARSVPAQNETPEQFIVEDDVLIETRDGIPIAAIVVRDAESERQPTVLLYSIYRTDNDVAIARYAARWGFASVIAYTRGVKTGAASIVPYEHDAQDAYDVIEWISQQPWSDGQVGMYGGSYSGFVQWAVARLAPPALKTIVPQVSAAPGIGEPIENGVFVTQLAYLWPLNNVYYRQAPDTFYDDLYRSGVAYRDLGRISGLENPAFDRWIEHPGFDGFWRSIVTDGDEFENIDIPVLTTTGYYDDAQLGALYYFREHYRHNPNAEHYLVIGPYDHFGGQVRPARELRGYEIDPAANYLMGDLALEWLDYILKGRDKPALIVDTVNYEVMGADRWRHAPSLEAMSNSRLRLYLSSSAANDGANDKALVLTPLKPGADAYQRQVVNFADRDTQTNVFTPLIVTDRLFADNALVFVSEPLEKSVELAGNVSGELVITINKRDVDPSFALYEQLPNGEYFFLNRYLGRASYANDRSNRALLRAGEKAVVPFSQTKLTSRKLSEGSRLVLVLGVNKHPFEQINYGTGKDVSDESISDAGTSLEILWHSESFIDIPLWREPPR
jgi:uncharacterized protein